MSGKICIMSGKNKLNKEDQLNISLKYVNLEYKDGEIKRLDNKPLTIVDIKNTFDFISDDDLYKIMKVKPPLFKNLDKEDLIWKWQYEYDQNYDNIWYDDIKEYNNKECMELFNYIYEKPLILLFPYIERDYIDKNDKYECKRCGNEDGYKCNNCRDYYCEDCYHHRIHYSDSACSYPWHNGYESYKSLLK